MPETCLFCGYSNAVYKKENKQKEYQGEYFEVSCEFTECLDCETVYYTLEQADYVLLQLQEKYMEKRNNPN